jgi:hypothetical protein
METQKTLQDSLNEVWKIIGAANQSMKLADKEYEKYKRDSEAYWKQFKTAKTEGAKERQ